jgi:two-component system, NarL family, sensor histidine kinase EvgS
VEDHPANRQIIAAQLRFLGFDTFAVDRGQAAIDAFGHATFVAVLLDCELPDMLGYDIAAELRAREAAAGGLRTPFIAISAKDGDDHIRRCHASGIDIVMGKPLSLDRLRDALLPVLAQGADVLSVFRTEALRDVATARRASAGGDEEGVRRALHRVHGAALVLQLGALEPHLLAATDASGDAALLASRLDELVEALHAFTIASHAPE